MTATRPTRSRPVGRRSTLTLRRPHSADPSATSASRSKRQRRRPSAEAAAAAAASSARPLPTAAVTVTRAERAYGRGRLMAAAQEVVRLARARASSTASTITAARGERVSSPSRLLVAVADVFQTLSLSLLFAAASLFPSGPSSTHPPRPSSRLRRRPHPRPRSARAVADPRGPSLSTTFRRSTPSRTSKASGPIGGLSSRLVCARRAAVGPPLRRTRTGCRRTTASMAARSTRTAAAGGRAPTARASTSCYGTASNGRSSSPTPLCVLPSLSFPFARSAIHRPPNASRPPDVASGLLDRRARLLPACLV